MGETNTAPQSTELMAPDAVGERDIPVFDADSGESHTVAVTATSGDRHVRDEVEARKRREAIRQAAFENSFNAEDQWQYPKH